MSLETGSRLGPYEILGPLGAGGMGEVYRARDSRLSREVAIKVLPAEFASDASRLRRFEKESRAASALNHPNIVTIYEIGTSDATAWIAMERVDGKTLRELLFSGAMPIKRLLAMAAQIADGLAAAHTAGIVHRDLKPENVMVTPSGLLKILDFGLAKRTSPGSGSDEGSHLPTETGTSPGMILGTVGYMSPEQAAGQPVDFRSDQFAFGSILYEMATGKRAFQKKTAVDTLSAILNEEPAPIVAASSPTPIALRWIVERCHAKEPERRYGSTNDLASDLGTLRDHITELTSGSTLADEGFRPKLRLPLVGPVVAAIALLAAGVLGGRWLLSRRVTTDVPSFHRLTFRRGNTMGARFAPDGRTVVYGAAWEGAPVEIFNVRSDSIESRPVGLSRADVLAVSSKGELAVLLKKTSLLYGGSGTLARIPLEGGTPREVLENVLEADWSPNGEDLAVVVRREASGKSQLQYPIGTVLAEADWFMSMRVSPKGDLIAYCGKGKSPDGVCALKTIDRKGRRSVISDGWHNVGGLVWSPRGDEILFEAGRRPHGDEAIRAVTLSGRERVLLPNATAWNLHDVASDGRLLVEHFASRGGIACQPQGENRERELGRQDRSSVRAISGDGKLVAFAEQGEAADSGIYLRKADGTPAIRLGDASWASDISSDGRWVLCSRIGPPPELVMMPIGPGVPMRIPLEANQTAMALLPDGRIVVTYPDKKGKEGTFLTGPGGGNPKPVRPDIGGYLIVSADGNRVLKEMDDRHLEIAPITAGNPVTVPGSPLEPNDEILQWTPDGRFLYLWRKGELPAPVDRLELATGRRELWKRLMPDDPAGIVNISPVILGDEGKSYAYSYLRILVSDLYVVDGVK